jgi:hypothetical protein
VDSSSSHSVPGKKNPAASVLKRKKRRDEPDVISKITHLAAFDNCIETSDALAASSGETETVLTARKDARTGLPDCSLLVSPDGDLLLVPQGKPEELFSKKTLASVQISEHLDAAEKEEGEGKGGEEKQRSAFSELMKYGKDEYESAMFLGNDMNPAGDRALNGFSAKGWSLPASSLAIDQTEESLTSIAHFCEQLVLSRKEAAARNAIACDNLRLAGGGPAVSKELSDQWEIIDPRATDFEVTENRVGPFLAPDSTLRAATVALEQYHAACAEMESNRWRMASLQHNTRGVLPAIHTANDKFHIRAEKRRQALEETTRRARFMEDKLIKLKKEAERKWEKVYAAEEKVTKRLELLMTARREERQKARLKQLQEQETQRRAAAEETASGTGAVPAAMSDDIWDMVNSVADSMDHGSFEPMDLPAAPSSPPSSPGKDVKSDDGASTASFKSASSQVAEYENDDRYRLAPSTPESSIPSVASREDIEQALGLPELRAAAMRADENIQDAATSLLNILNSLDTTRRSARVAAETCLVSAGNAQAACLRSMLKLERDSLEERLRELGNLEEIMDQIDVRADLDAYITADKKEPGGSSHLRDDDDGGIASALAILSSHVDETEGGDSMRIINSMVCTGPEASGQPNETTPEELEEALEVFFQDKAGLGSGAPDTQETAAARSDFEKTVDFLCRTAKDTLPSGRARRSAICYILNGKRATNAMINTSIQFDGLCRLFSAILDGCNEDAHDGGVSNAKMCIMLMQTFYLDNVNRDADQNDSESGPSVQLTPIRKARKGRVYVKSRLVGHKLWTNDEFWDTALTQQVKESLTHSGVMSNFERGHRRLRRSEWAQQQKTRWYDLNYTERIEAASQVHAVVFAQLGALAHSMIELGCGLERACSFVRRMAIRHQLPSSQRTMLLVHLVDREDVQRQESK